MAPARFTDAEIIARLRSGDERQVNQATDYLLGLWQGLVAKLVRLYRVDRGAYVLPVLNESLAELIRDVQEGIFNPERSGLSTYFYAIARNQLLNILRKDNNWRSLHENWDRLPEQAPLLDENAAKLMESEENRKRIREAILKLDKPCQKVLFDYWWEGKSLKEIAGELGTSWDATKQKHHRCLEHLRKLLKDTPLE